MTHIKLADILEYAGDPSGSPTFQGGPYGIGGKEQLAKPDPSEELVDPAEEEQRKVRGHLGNWYKNPPSISKHHLSLSERNESDWQYRDLPGWPRMSTLVAKKQFVPQSEEEADDPDLQRIALLPGQSGRDTNKSAWFGTGPLDVNPLTLEPVPTAPEELTLLQKGAESMSTYKDTKPENRGKLTIKTNELAKPQKFVPDPHGEETGQEINHLEDPEIDVPSRPGTMAWMSNPKKNVPDNVRQKKRNAPKPFISLADILGMR